MCVLFITSQMLYLIIIFVVLCVKCICILNYIIYTHVFLSHQCFNNCFVDKIQNETRSFRCPVFIIFLHELHIFILVGIYSSKPIYMVLICIFFYLSTCQSNEHFHDIFNNIDQCFNQLSGHGFHPAPYIVG